MGNERKKKASSSSSFTTPNKETGRKRSRTEEDVNKDDKGNANKKTAGELEIAGGSLADRRKIEEAAIESVLSDREEEAET